MSGSKEEALFQQFLDWKNDCMSTSSDQDSEFDHDEPKKAEEKG